jgi:thiamine biosynthesis lipoprotein
MDQPLFRHSFAAMTTQCELQFYGVSPAQGQALAAQIEARVEALVQRYNFHAPQSWLNTAVNGRRSDRVALDAECAEVLAVVREHAARTQGAFDITVGTYAGQLARAKTTADVAAVRKRLAPRTGLDRWALDGQTLHFDNPYTRFDLGGVIKEHAVDVSARMAQEAGVEAGLVNYGGDIYAFGLKPGQQRFVASVPNPLDPAQMLFGLDLQDQALTTSAHYARQRAIKGAVLSHVVGADVAQARWLSASVVSRSALVSGIYSTALLLRDDIALPADVLAVVVDRTGEVHPLPSPATDNFSESTETSLCI